MCYTNIYSNIKVYQKYRDIHLIGCTTRSLYASSGPKAEGVPTYNQRGRGKIELPMDVRYSKSGDMTSSVENGLNIITNARPKIGQDQMS